ncbi:hypothetical protein [Actinomadura chokoriensis]|uniref:hypothetical protein n=1 Tax=Actinomadura chokoriensis TaxID=454156 RepID=UPI0031F9DDC5
MPLGSALPQGSSLCKELIKKGEQDAHRLFILLRGQVSEIRPSAVLIDLAEHKERLVEFTPSLATKSKPLMKILEQGAPRPYFIANQEGASTLIGSTHHIDAVMLFEFCQEP